MSNSMSLFTLILFNRFKKKTITLLYNLFPENLSYLLEMIRNKKIVQYLFKIELKFMLEEKTLIVETNEKSNFVGMVYYILFFLFFLVC